MAISNSRFFSFVKKSKSCWLWKRGLTGNGYGRIICDGEEVLAHRYSYEITKGKIPKGKWVLHKCDVPRCVNPKHLTLGTAKENSIDMVLKGRQGRQKLTVEKIMRIRELCANNIYTQAKLACMYGVHFQTVSRVCRGKAWPHLKLKPIILKTRAKYNIPQLRGEK